MEVKWPNNRLSITFAFFPANVAVGIQNLVTVTMLKKPKKPGALISIQRKKLAGPMVACPLITGVYRYL